MVLPLERKHLLAAFAGDDKGIDLPRPDSQKGLFGLFEPKPEGSNFVIKRLVRFSFWRQGSFPIEGRAPG